MKKFIIMAIAILMLASVFQIAKAAPAEPGTSVTISTAKGAVVELNDIVIRKMGDEVNFRVRVKNIGTLPAKNLKNNMVIYLRVKDTATGNWRELQQWSNIDVIKAGQTIARDRTPVKSVDPAVLSGNFTLQAEIAIKNPGKVTISRAILEKSYPQDGVKNP